MYADQYLVKERQEERRRNAEDGRAGQAVAELRKLERRQERAERRLAEASRRAEQLRSMLSAS